MSLKELEEKSREFIPSFCDFVELDLFYNIDGFVYKAFHAYSDDAKTRSFLSDVLTKAVEYAHLDRWQQVYFTEVFHPFSGKTATGYRINLVRDGLKTGMLSYDEDEYRYLYRGSFSGDSKLQREK